MACRNRNNQMGHFARECPQGGDGEEWGEMPQQKRVRLECGGPMPRQQRAPRGRGGGRGGGSSVCYNCNQPGHMSRECPMPRQERAPRGRGDRGTSGQAASHGVPRMGESDASKAREAMSDLRKLRDENAALFQKARVIHLEEQIDELKRETVRLGSIVKRQSKMIRNYGAMHAEQQRSIDNLLHWQLLEQTRIGVPARIKVLADAVRERLGIPASLNIEHLPAIRAAVKNPGALLEQCPNLTAKGLKTKWEELVKDYPVIDDEDALKLIEIMMGPRNDAALHTAPKPVAHSTDTEELSCTSKKGQMRHT